MGTRTLILRKEALAELATADLARVGGGGTVTPDCLAISRMAISLCGCLTQWCSIDVC